MASIADVYVTLLPETGKIADGIKKALLAADRHVEDAAKRWRREIEAIFKGTEVKVQLKVDTQKAKKELEAAAKDQVATVETKVDKPSATKTEGELRTLTRDRTAKVKVKVDEQSLKKVSAQLAKSTGFGKGGGVPIPGARGALPPALAVGAISVAPNVVPLIGSMVQSVGQLSGVLGLIPASAGAAALAITSLKIATAGFGDAMKNLGDPEKFNESVAQLAPSMQVAARGIQALLPQITQLKMTVGQAFGEGFGDQVQKLGSTYLPIFQNIMSRMSQSAGVTLGGIAKQLQTPEMQQDIKTFGTNASQAFSNLLQAAQPLVKAFVDIATVGSSFLPQLATTVADLAKRFGDFIGEARESGKLAEWIQGGITALTQLKDIAVNTWNIFKGIFEAAGGGDFLQTISDLTEKWTIWVNSVEGQNALRNFFDDARTALEQWWPILRDAGISLWNAFKGVKGVVDQILPLLQQITGFLARHQGLVEAIGVAFGAWKLASIVQDIGKIGAALLGLQGTAATAGTGIRTALMSALGIGTTLGTVTIALAVAGGALAIWAGTKLLERGDTIQLPVGDVGGSGLNPVSDNQSVTGTGTPVNRTSRHPNQGPAYQPNIYGAGLPPQPHGGVTQDIPRISGPSPNALPDVSQQQAPDTNTYNPPAPSSPGGGGTPGGSTTTPVAPAGESYDYTGFGELNWDALAELEAGGNWSANTGNGFYGGLQFVQSTWEAHGGLQFAPSADKADKADQIKVATALYNKEGAAPWPTNGWVLTATDDQLKNAGMTSTGRPRSSSGSRGGNRGRGNAPQPVPYGLPGGSNSGGYGGSGVQFPSWVNQVGQEFNVKPSTYPGHQETDRNEPGYAPNPQHQNRAIDWAGSTADMQKLADWAVAHPEQFEQMIWKNPDTGLEYGVAGGKVVSGSGTAQAGYFGESNQGYPGHTTHVHTRQSHSWGQGEDGGPGSGYSYDGPGGDRTNPMYVSSADTSGQQLGKDIVSGVMEIFGLGDLFKDPTQFGIFKIFKALMGVHPGGERDNGNDNGSGGGGDPFNLGGGSNGGGDPLTSMLSSFVPNADGSGGISDMFSQFVPGANTATVDNSQNVTVNNQNAPADMGFVMDTVDTQLINNGPNRSILRGAPK